MHLWSTQQLRWLRERYVNITFTLQKLYFTSFFYFLFLENQVEKLNDETNWRIGLQVKLVLRRSVCVLDIMLLSSCLHKNAPWLIIMWNLYSQNPYWRLGSQNLMTFWMMMNHQLVNLPKMPCILATLIMSLTLMYVLDHNNVIKKIRTYISWSEMVSTVC